MNYSTFSLANGAVPAPHLRNDHRQLEFALAYAERCWLVIPNHTPDPTSAGDAGECSCMPFDRCRKGYPGKHPRFLKDELEHGFKDATADPERICRWWSQWAVANIGIQPKLSCLAILDIDRRNGGDVSLGQLVATNGPLPPTPTVQRDSVGIVHYYFRLRGTRLRIRIKKERNFST